MAKTTKNSNSKIKKLTGTFVLKEIEDKEPYAIENSDLIVNVDYKFVDKDHEQELVQKISGILSSDYFINNTELEFIKSWRVEIYNIKILGFSYNVSKNMLEYKFIADRFEILDEVEVNNG